MNKASISELVVECWTAAVVAAVALLGPHAAAQTLSVVQSTCAALNEDSERLASFEARTLAELSLRNPSVRRVVVTCSETSAEVRIEPQAGTFRSGRLPVTPDRQHLVDDLLAAVWDLAPEPSPPPPRASPATPKPRPPRAPREPERWFVLGRFGGELWSGTIRGLWGPDVGGGWSRGPWSASLSVGSRRPVEAPGGLALSELGGGIAAYAMFLGPLEAGLGGHLWRVSAQADAPTAPSERATWSGTASFTLRLRLELKPLTLAFGPQLVLRAPRIAIALDQREVAGLPWLAGGAALELRLCP